MSKERRGGNRQSQKEKQTYKSTVNFIKQPKPIESHYGRNKTTARLYLSPLLNIRQLWLAWKIQYLQEDSSNLIFSRKRFYEIFVTILNIGFGFSRTDVCSTIEMYKNESKIAEKKEMAELS